MSYELSCSSSEQKNDIYVFEIKINYFDNTSVKHRIISMNKFGELFTAKNNIKKLLKFQIHLLIQDSRVCFKTVCYRFF